MNSIVHKNSKFDTNQEQNERGVRREPTEDPLFN
jgi:hypothetical protein